MSELPQQRQQTISGCVWGGKVANFHYALITPAGNKSFIRIECVTYLHPPKQLFNHDELFRNRLSHQWLKSIHEVLLQLASGLHIQTELNEAITNEVVRYSTMRMKEKEEKQIEKCGITIGW